MSAIQPFQPRGKIIPVGRKFQFVCWLIAICHTYLLNQLIILHSMIGMQTSDYNHEIYYQTHLSVSFIYIVI